MNFIGLVLHIGITAVLFLVCFAPSILSVLFLTHRLRYREILGGLSFFFSLILLSTSGDYVYNVLNWSGSRPSLATAIVTIVALFGGPIWTSIAIGRYSRWRKIWVVVIVLSTSAVIASTVRSYKAREHGDQNALQQGQAVLSPATGTHIIKAWRDPSSVAERYYLRGHVASALRIPLLSDPFGKEFKPDSCWVVTGEYRPASKDPMDVGNVTVAKPLSKCPVEPVFTVAYLGDALKTYRAIPFSKTSAPSGDLIRSPLVVEGFQKARLDPKALELRVGDRWEATYRPGKKISVSTLVVGKPPLNAFPCENRAAVVTAGASSIFLPSCAERWTLFTLNKKVYFAAVTQDAALPGTETMNPEITEWLYEVETSETPRLVAQGSYSGQAF